MAEALQLQLVLQAAAAHAAALEHQAANPWSVLGEHTPQNSANRWAAKRKAEADAIRAAIAELNSSERR